MEQRYIFDIVMKEFNSRQVQFWSWGAANFAYDYKLVQFDVQGRHFIGRVEIAFNHGSDAFDLEFLADNGPGPLESVKTIERVYITNLVDEIDNYIEA